MRRAFRRFCVSGRIRWVKTMSKPSNRWLNILASCLVFLTTVLKQSDSVPHQININFPILLIAVTAKKESGKE